MHTALRVEDGKYIAGLGGSAKASNVFMSDGVTSVEDALNVEYLYNTAQLKIWKRDKQVYLSAQGVTCDSNFKIAELPDGWKPTFVPIPPCLVFYNYQWQWGYFGLNASTGDITVGSISQITVGSLNVGSAIYGQCTWLVD